VGVDITLLAASLLIGGLIGGYFGGVLRLTPVERPDGTISPGSGSGAPSEDGGIKRPEPPCKPTVECLDGTISCSSGSGTCSETGESSARNLQLRPGLSQTATSDATQSHLRRRQRKQSALMEPSVPIRVPVPALITGVLGEPGTLDANDAGEVSIP